MPKRSCVRSYPLPLKGRSGRLLPSDSAPVLQCGSETSSDFLTKILGIDTPLFLCEAQFYCSSYLLLLRKIRKTGILQVPQILLKYLFVDRGSSVSSVFACVTGYRVRFPVTSLIAVSIMALETLKFHLYNKCRI
jgi:hypothetical protein